jgi:hypothetical protein
MGLYVIGSFFPALAARDRVKPEDFRLKPGQNFVCTVRM